jgi:hypothetical protein
MFLAQLTNTTPAEIAGWIGCGFFLVAGWNQVERFLERRLNGSRTDVSELQQKVNKVDREVGELRASLELNHQQLARIDAKLDRVIERKSGRA